MESHASTQLKVGIFIAIGAVFILGSIFFLGADKALFTSYVRLHAHFEQVQGLSVGSVVSLSGVTVGNVEAITFLPETNALDVKMKINKDFIQRITEGSQVEIRTQGALGDKFVFIIPADSRGKVVTEGTVLEVAKASDIIGVLSERGGEAGKIFDVIDELRAITHAINAENRLGRIMQNLDSASMSLTNTSKDVRLMTSQVMAQNSGEKLGKSIDRLNSILAKVDQGQGSLGALINDPTLHNQLKSLLGGSVRKNHVKTLLRTSIEQDDN